MQFRKRDLVCPRGKQIGTKCPVSSIAELDSLCEYRGRNGVKQKINTNPKHDQKTS